MVGYNAGAFNLKNFWNEMDDLLLLCIEGFVDSWYTHDIWRSFLEKHSHSQGNGL